MTKICKSKVHSTGYGKIHSGGNGHRHPKISIAPTYYIFPNIIPNSRTPKSERPYFLNFI